MALSPEQRAAQRSVVGLVRGGSAVVSRVHGLCIWRSPVMEQVGVSTAEITAHLEALEIPYTVAIVVRLATKRRPRRAGYEVRVAWTDLGKVTRWVPSLRPLVEAVEGMSPESRPDSPPAP